MSGVLYALADPGPNVPEDQFHDWYNNEHGPARTSLAGFQSGLRYKATDGLTPPWLATYELDDIALMQSPVYTQLRENRSPREARVVSALPVLDRSIYRLVATLGEFHAEPNSISVNLVLTVPSEACADLEDWYTKEHMPMLSRIPGWLRSRLLVTDASSRLKQYLAVHEYMGSNGLEGPEHKAAKSTPWRTRVMANVQGSPQRRVFSLYRVISKVPNDLEHLPSGTPPVIDSFYQREDGIKLHYRLEGNPTGPIVAFSNSLLTDMHIWDQMVAHLVPKYKVLRYDTRGHGLSTTISSEALISDLSSDLLSLLTALNITRLHSLIGVSLGGVTSMHFALHHPTYLGQLIASDCNLASTPVNNAAWDARIALARSTEPGSGLPELARQTIPRWFLPPSREREDIQAVKKMILATSLAGLESGIHALCHYNLQAKFPELQVPALFLAGEKDGILPDAMKAFASRVSDGRFVPIEGSGHLPMVENPVAFWNAIASIFP